MGNPENLQLNEIGRVLLRTAEPLPIDDYATNRRNGAVLLIDPAAGKLSRRPSSLGTVGRVMNKRSSASSSVQANFWLTSFPFYQLDCLSASNSLLSLCL